MAKEKNIKPKKKLSEIFGFNFYVITILFLLVGVTVFLCFKAYNSGRTLIPISIIALVSGVVFEGKKIFEEWWAVFLTAIGSFVFSFIAFIPSKKEYSYNINNHIEAWPYFFVIIFILITIAVHRDKITPKLTEGITLLQSVAIVYWAFDNDFYTTNNLFLKLTIIVCLMFSLYTFFHAFTYTTLSRTARLTLSIWSSIIMVLFALDNIYRVHQNEQIENTKSAIDGFYIGLQFFLLGVSSIYFAQNLIMLVDFLPGKGTFFNKQYFHEIKKLKSEHVKRYSEQQIKKKHSFFGVIFMSTVFVFNYQYNIVPCNIAIWATFFLFPFILVLSSSAKESKNKKQ